MLIFREGVHVCRSAHISWPSCDAGSYFASFLRFVVASLKHLVPGKAGSNRKQPLVYRPGNTPDCMMTDSEPSV